MEEMPIETLKEEMVAMVQEEEMPFNGNDGGSITLLLWKNHRKKNLKLCLLDQ